MMRKSTQLFFLSFLYLSPPDALVEAYIKSRDGKILSQENDQQLWDHSSKEVIDDEMKPKLADEHQYYLPMQTTFGSPLDPSSYGGSITSPPHITISPSSAEASYGQSTDVVMVQDTYLNDDHITAYLSHCITETPSQDEQLQSELLLPSKELMPKSVVLSGQIEIASKTSNEGTASKVSNVGSKPSLAQGTQIYMSSITEV